MRKTIGSVIDEINEWEGRNGTVYYVTAFSTDDDVISVGKKSLDAAIEVQGLLREVIDVEQEFALESKGQTKTFKDKFNLKAFGPPGQAWTYSTLKEGQSAPSEPLGTETGRVPEVRSRSAATSTGTAPNSDLAMRASVALKAAANACPPVTNGSDLAWLEKVAGELDAWLEYKASGRPPEPGEGVGEGKASAEPGEASVPSSTEGHWQERVKDWPTDG
jgi:hypothetical protein